MFLLQTARPDSLTSVVNSLEQIDLESTVAGCVALSEDFVPDGATEVYTNYNFQHQYDLKLPITQRREEVIFEYL